MGDLTIDADIADPVDADRKISPLFLCKVLCTRLAASTTEIVNAVGAILSYVNFFVWGGNFVADHHGRIETIL